MRLECTVIHFAVFIYKGILYPFLQIHFTLSFTVPQFFFLIRLTHPCHLSRLIRYSTTSNCAVIQNEKLSKRQ
jgi:hypothetical protein